MNGLGSTINERSRNECRELNDAIYTNDWPQFVLGLWYNRDNTAGQYGNPTCDMARYGKIMGRVEFNAHYDEKEDSEEDQCDAKRCECCYRITTAADIATVSTYLCALI